MEEKLEFRSERAGIVTAFVWGFLAILVAGIIITAFTDEKLLPLLITALPAGILAWSWLDTRYTISGNNLYYKSGILSGHIQISSIRHITKNKTLWSGYKPAIGLKGLIIQHGKWDEIYLSPERKEEFLQVLLALNPTIEIVDAETEQPKFDYNKY